MVYATLSIPIQIGPILACMVLVMSIFGNACSWRPLVVPLADRVFWPTLIGGYQSSPQLALPSVKLWTTGLRMTRRILTSYPKLLSRSFLQSLVYSSGALRPDLRMISLFCSVDFSTYYFRIFRYTPQCLLLESERMICSALFKLLQLWLHAET